MNYCTGNENSTSFARRHDFSLTTTAVKMCGAGIASGTKKRTYVRKSRKPLVQNRTQNIGGNKIIRKPQHENAAEQKHDINPRTEMSLKAIAVKVKDNEFINRSVAKAEMWLEVDDKRLRVDGKRKKIPLPMMVIIMVISLSLLLVVAGSVITSIASMELYAEENKLDELRSEQTALERELELKNDLMYIEKTAREKLGMIDRDYARVEYISRTDSDSIEIYEKPTRGAGFASLLDALDFLR